MHKYLAPQLQSRDQRIVSAFLLIGVIVFAAQLGQSDVSTGPTVTLIPNGGNPCAPVGITSISAVPGQQITTIIGGFKADEVINLQIAGSPAHHIGVTNDHGSLITTDRPLTTSSLLRSLTPQGFPGDQGVVGSIYTVFAIGTAHSTVSSAALSTCPSNLIVSPGVVKVGHPTVVSGSGFAASTVVTLTDYVASPTSSRLFSPLHQGLTEKTATNGIGSFSIPLTLPTTMGTYTIRAQDATGIVATAIVYDGLPLTPSINGNGAFPLSTSPTPLATPPYHPALKAPALGPSISLTTTVGQAMAVMTTGSVVVSGVHTTMQAGGTSVITRTSSSPAVPPGIPVSFGLPINPSTRRHAQATVVGGATQCPAVPTLLRIIADNTRHKRDRFGPPYPVGCLWVPVHSTAQAQLSEIKGDRVVIAAYFPDRTTSSATATLDERGRAILVLPITYVPPEQVAHGEASTIIALSVFSVTHHRSVSYPDLMTRLVVIRPFKRASDSLLLNPAKINRALTMSNTNP